MSFSGFSEDDIRKLKVQETTKSQKGVNKNSIKKVNFKTSNTSNTSRSTKSIINHAVNNNTTKLQTQELPHEARLSIPNKTTTNNSDCVNNSTVPTAAKIEDKSDAPVIVNNEPTIPDIKYEKKIINLDEFEAKQKLVEEQNRKRKELLAKALADRTKRTQEEAQRLNEIQEEFKKLDAMLSSDVKILRKQIEVASIEYMECQKRYNKIEKDFLDAKVLLHQKLEKKEMLTEHLCTIIEKNEERKAEKLTELLQKLQVEMSDIKTEENVNNT